MKKLIWPCFFILILSSIWIYWSKTSETSSNGFKRISIQPRQKGAQKTLDERQLFSEARQLSEFYKQVNPVTGNISKAEKEQEFEQAKSAQSYGSDDFARAVQSNYISRGPSNFGGRARALVIDITDPTENTMIAAGVTGGVFRTTDGGSNWVKVSPFDEIHNATCIVQDPRNGFTNVWYYGTGEFWFPNVSAGGFSGSPYFGQGIWRSTDNGVTWNQMPSTASEQTDFDSPFDYVSRLAVNPVTGDLLAAINGEIARFNGSEWITEIANPTELSNFAGVTDVVVSNSGRVYAAFSGQANLAVSGVWTSPNGNGDWERISPFIPFGRVVLALAPSNNNKLYTLFVNGNTANCIGPVQEADLWLWNQADETYTNLTNLLPFEGGCLANNDPFSVQLGWDLTVAVKPDDEDFVLIGGTNAYRKADITDTTTRFDRIGGYLSASSYAIYNLGSGIEQHPDQHEFVFSNLDTNVCFSATDGGIHRTSNISATTVGWQNLNNNFQTYQFFHVAQDPLPGSDIVIGGTQDNGTTVGGVGFGLPSSTIQTRVFGGDGVAVGIGRDPTCRAYFGVQNGPIFRVGCNNTGFTEITPNGSSSQFVTYFYLDPDNNNALYYAGEDTLYKTTSVSNVSPSTWVNMGDTSSQFGHGDFFQTFSASQGAYDPSSSYLLMGGDEGHIYRLDDPWNSTSIGTARDITPPTATTGFPSYVTGLAVHPTNNDIVLATYSNYGISNIFLTTNASANNPTWTVVERNLSAHSIRSAAITEVDGEVLYFVGTARGLYSSTDPTTEDWVREAPNQIGFALVSSLSYRNEDKKLLVGTFGNGMFEGSLTGTLSDEDITFNNTSIKLFPNPVVNELQIDIPGADLSIAYRILNSIGQTISNQTEYVSPFDVSNLEAGMYFVEIEYGSKKEIKRFIKK